MTHDLFPKHEEPANWELSIDELDAVAAGSILGDIWNWLQGKANDKVNEYKAYYGLVVDTGRTLRQLF